MTKKPAGSKPFKNSFTVQVEGENSLDDPEFVVFRESIAGLVFMEQLGQGLHVQSVIVIDLLRGGCVNLWH